MTRGQQIVVIAMVGALTLCGLAAGWFAALDAGLRDLRFSLTSRPASGDIVFVEINADAMSGIEGAEQVHPIYARAVARLVEEGAETIVLDVPSLSADSGPGGELLLDALAQAVGKVRSVAVEAREDGASVLRLPGDHIAALASPVFVAGTSAPDERSGRYRTRIVNEGWIIESLALALNPGRRVAASSFLIDFSIDLDSVPRVTLSSVFEGAFAPELFVGKQVLLGYSSYSQQSSQPAPRYGVLSTPAIQVLATETVRQDRMLSEMGRTPIGMIVIAGALIFAYLRSRMALAAALLGSLAYSGVIEFTALVLQVHSAILFDTAGIHVAQFGFLVAAFWHELDHRGRSLDRAARERDSVRGLLERVVADNFDGMVVIDGNRTIRTASRLAETLIAPQLTGRRYDEVLPAPFRAALDRAFEQGESMEEVAEVTVSCQGEDREIEFVVTLSGTDRQMEGGDGGARVACLTFRDITARRHAEERLTYLAQHDPLTGAAARGRFLDDLRGQLASPAKRVRGASVYLVGLSRLKMVNDTLGHAYGDALLKQVVSRLGLLAPASIARLEGNAFAVLRPGLIGSQEGQDFANRLIAEVSRPYHLDGHYAIVGARVGMSDSDLSGTAPDAIVAHANLALSIAADQPDNRAIAFCKDMDATIKAKQDMEIALRAALETSQFTVHYQPQVDLDSGEISGVEALARWVHPQLGQVPPSEFIAAAEQTGLILELGRWVLHAATREVASWGPRVRVSVNVSPLQFEYGDVVGDVRSALAASGLPAEQLAIEITESLLVTETSDTTEKLRELRQMGVSVALDDFGTGYSSLSYLGRLPVDTIKIDQRFVRGLPDDQEASAIVRMVLMLSETLGKHVVAEGIETQDQAWLLRLAGCNTGQGYYFARPAPAETILALLHDAERDLMGTRLSGRIRP